jgi:hypothetical protein
VVTVPCDTPTSAAWRPPGPPDQPADRPATGITAVFAARDACYHDSRSGVTPDAGARGRPYRRGMTRFDRDDSATGRRIVSPSAIVWNLVLPLLGLALILGAPVLPAVAIAAGAVIVIGAALASGSRTGMRPPPVRPA